VTTNSLNDKSTSKFKNSKLDLKSEAK